MKVLKLVLMLTLLFFVTSWVVAQEETAEVAPTLILDQGGSFGELEQYVSVHLFTVLMQENTDEYSFEDYEASGRLELAAGDYEIRILVMAEWSEYSSIAEVAVASVEASPCTSGRDNRAFDNEFGWDAIMFCDGYIDWSVTSDSLGAVMVVMELDIE